MFLDAYVSRDRLAKRPELGLEELVQPDGQLDVETRITAQREVADLLVEQVEYADVVILNKDELLTPARRSVLREVSDPPEAW